MKTGKKNVAKAGKTPLTAANIQLRWTPEIGEALAFLQSKTQLNQSGAIRLAIMEAVERRGGG